MDDQTLRPFALRHQLDHLDGKLLLDRMGGGVDRHVARQRASEPPRCTLPAAC